MPITSFLDHIAPETTLTLSAWADRYHVLTSRSAAEPGPYYTQRTPYLRAIMDDLSVGSTVQRIVLKKALPGGRGHRPYPHKG